MRLVRFLRVRGQSMEPIIRDGAVVLVSSLPYVFRKPRAGDVVVAQHPFERRLIVKQVERIVRDGRGDRVFLRGVNKAQSQDSEAFGSLAISSLVGKVCYVRSS